MPTEPFRMLRYADVPELPVVPHRWADATRSEIAIETAELGAIKIAMREYGAGPPLLLIHGMGTTSYSWRYMLELLGSRYRLLMPDLPGAGDSDHPDVYLGPDVMARAIIAIIDVLGVRGGPVVANSMGGYLAMRAALLDPKAMSRLVNEHSPGIPTGRMIALRWALKLLPSWTLMNWMLRRDPEKWIHEHVHYFDESMKSREEHRAYATQLHRVEGRKTYYRQLRDMLDAKGMAQFEKQLGQTPFPIPLQLVYAKKDPMVPPIVGERLKALIPAAELVWLEDASHFAHVDAAARFVAAIEPFLDG